MGRVARDWLGLEKKGRGKEVDGERRGKRWQMQA